MVQYVEQLSTGTHRIRRIHFIILFSCVTFHIWPPLLQPNGFSGMKVLFPELNRTAIINRIQRQIFASMDFLKLNKDIVPCRSSDIHPIDWLVVFLV